MDDLISQRLAQELARAQEGARAAAARSSDARADYENRIRMRVRSNLVRPPGLSGNPEAEFAVTQLPDGTVTNVRMIRSSGFNTLDEAIERAIRVSSPLPLPASPELFQRELRLRFRPLEE